MCYITFPYPYDNTNPYQDWQQYRYPTQSNPRKIKRTTKTIEKYDTQGKLIGREVITEEVEIYDEYYYQGPLISDSTGGTPNNCSIFGSQTNSMHVAV